MASYTTRFPDRAWQDAAFSFKNLDLLTTTRGYPLEESKEVSGRSTPDRVRQLSNLNHDFLRKLETTIRTRDPWIDIFFNASFTQHPLMKCIKTALTQFITADLSKDRIWAGALSFFWKSRFDYGLAVSKKLSERDRSLIASQLNDTDEIPILQRALDTYGNLVLGRYDAYEAVAKLILEGDNFISTASISPSSSALDLPGQVAPITPTPISAHVRLDSALAKAAEADAAVLQFLCNSEYDLAVSLLKHVKNELEIQVPKLDEDKFNPECVIFSAPWSDPMPALMKRFQISKAITPVPFPNNTWYFQDL